MDAVLLACLLGYALGSVPFAYLLLRRFHGIDVRDAGSGNSGAFNSYEVSGSPSLGVVVLFLDALKGMASVWCASVLWPAQGAMALLSAVASVAGHNYSLWLRGRGGRGLATAAGAMLLLSPPTVVVWLVFWGLGYAVFRNVNVGNGIASVLSIAALIVLPEGSIAFLFRPAISVLGFRIAGSAIMVVILTKLIEPIVSFVRGRCSPDIPR